VVLGPYGCGVCGLWCVTVCDSRIVGVRCIWRDTLFGSRVVCVWCVWCVCGESLMVKVHTHTTLESHIVTMV